jgi:hypothetical protein
MLLFQCHFGTNRAHDNTQNGRCTGYSHPKPLTGAFLVADSGVVHNGRVNVDQGIAKSSCSFFIIRHKGQI